MNNYNDYLDISWKEKEKIRHEININYKKYSGLRIIAHLSVGFDNKYYIYYVENNGFDEYIFIAKVPDLD